MAAGDPDDPGSGGDRAEGDALRDLFAEAMRGVQPIEPPPRIRPARRSPGQARRADAPPPAPARFELEQTGERIEGYVPGFDRRRLGRLARGELPPERTVDLHGALEAEARLAVRDTLRRARRSDARIVLVIHGRGLHSAGGPVLKTSLPLWLAEPPLGAWVLAFTSAPPGLGGPGATLVLLRTRPRRRR